MPCRRNNSTKLDVIVSLACAALVPNVSISILNTIHSSYSSGHLPYYLMNVQGFVRLSSLRSTSTVRICYSRLQYASIHTSQARREKAPDLKLDDLADLRYIEDQFALIKEQYRELIPGLVHKKSSLSYYRNP